MTNPIDHDRRAPWTVDAGVDRVTASWLQRGQVRECLTADRLLPATEARFAGRPQLHPGLEQALDRRGIHQLYTHQVQAIQAARQGNSVIVATPTASGKSLCFHLPVIQALAEDPGASALFVYPTKALSRDQEHGLHAMMRDAGLAIPSIVFDGDTPGDARQKARERGRIVLTNPDMLHAGILPNHTKWASFFRGLRYVVLDEMHTYRGVFGSHMAHVITRLKRIARFHGAHPTFIGATATIGNPREHASLLLATDEAELELVTDSGAPQSARRVFIYNPPVVNQELGVRGSSLKAAVRLAGDMVRARVPTILFGPSRNSVEVMLKYLRDRTAQDLAGSGVDANRAIMGYRGGYLPETRRQIERGLREGEILCVIATNALELGIDIGDLDCVICAGYAGSIAGTWQRFGRAGRRGKTSALVLVCSSGAVDQYLARTPEYLLEGTAEQALIDPTNTEVLIQHLKCAAFEAPFRMSPPGPRPAAPEPADGEAYGSLEPSSTRDALEYLVSLGVLHAAGGRYHYAGEAFPASHVSLRNIGWDNFVIIERGSRESRSTNGGSTNRSSLGSADDEEFGSGAGDGAQARSTATERTIGELDYRATHTMLHEQAIYQQDALQYQVELLDFDNHKAYVRRVEPDYFTTALTYRTVSILEPLEERASQDGQLHEGLGDVKVLEKVTGYKKIKFFTHENSGYGDVHLPVMEMHTTSYWLRLTEGFLEQFTVSRAFVIEALRGLGRALETVSAVALMCDPRDLNQTLADGGEDAPTLFLFDAQPGGVGLAARIYACAPTLFGRAGALITSCPCANGCPACIGPADDGQAAVPPHGLPRASDPEAAPSASADATPQRLSGARKRLALELLDRLGLGDTPWLH